MYHPPILRYSTTPSLQLVLALNLDFDLHVHTHHSPCGRAEMLPGEIVRTAGKRGIARLGLTDHLYTFTDPGIFEQTRAAVKHAIGGIRGRPEVFFGCEVEVMAPGRVAGGPDLAERLDFVMAGATHFQNVGITDLPPRRDDLSIAQYYVRMFEYAVSIPWVDVLAHPFFIVAEVCPTTILDLISDADLRPGIELAGENDVAMEISRRVFSPGQLEFSTRFYGLCKEAGLRFTIGSDAHCLADVGNVGILAPVISELGLTEKDFWFPQAKT
jgi:histidinol phosphatase-like PHP family hydrolase